MRLRPDRTDRSKAALKEAFLELMQTKEPDMITVVDLCVKARLNRSTFYAHFTDMDMLVRDVLRDAVADLIAGVDDQWSLPQEDGGIARSAIAAYLHRFQNNAAVTRFCTCANSGNYRNRIVRAHVDLALSPDRDQIQYYTAYYHNAGILNFIMEWLSSGRPLPEETVVDLIHEFSKAVFR